MIRTKRALGRLTVTEVAEILFSTAVQESEGLAPAQLRAVVTRTWVAAGADCSRFAAQLAQESGDHPEEAARRMRWALHTAERTVHSPGLRSGAGGPSGWFGERPPTASAPGGSATAGTRYAYRPGPR